MLFVKIKKNQSKFCNATIEDVKISNQISKNADKIEKHLSI